MEEKRVKVVRKRFCGDPVRDALQAIGRRRGRCDPMPGDFTAEERFRMFRHLMHGHVYPGADTGGFGCRIVYIWTNSVWRWRHGGRWGFVRLIRQSAQAELDEADYTVYDLSPIRCLVGGEGPRLCRMLAAADAAEMVQRMNGMEVDLMAVDRKLERLRRGRGFSGEIRYRIALYDHTYEAVIRGVGGGWLW